MFPKTIVIKEIFWNVIFKRIQKSIVVYMQSILIHSGKGVAKQSDSWINGFVFTMNVYKQMQQ